MRRLIFTLALLASATAVPAATQELDLSAFAAVPLEDSLGTAEYGFGATFELTSFGAVDVIGAGQYLHADGDEARSILAQVGARVNIDDFFLQWAVGRSFAHNADRTVSIADAFVGDLSAGWLFGPIGLFGRWYYDIPDDAQSNMVAIGAFLRL